MRLVQEARKEVAAPVGASRQPVHTWVACYLSVGVSGLTDRSHRPRSSPRQSADVARLGWRSCGVSIREPAADRGFGAG
jgi:hypothetical protein